MLHERKLNCFLSLNTSDSIGNRSIDRTLRSKKMADRNRSNKRTVIELDYEEIPVNNEPEEQTASKRRVGTASSSTVSEKKALTISQLRMLRGNGPSVDSKSRI